MATPAAFTLPAVAPGVGPLPAISAVRSASWWSREAASSSVTRCRSASVRGLVSRCTGTALTAGQTGAADRPGGPAGAGRVARRVGEPPAGRKGGRTAARTGRADRNGREKRFGNGKELKPDFYCWGNRYAGKGT